MGYVSLEAQPKMGQSDIRRDLLFQPCFSSGGGRRPSPRCCAGGPQFRRVPFTENAILTKPETDVVHTPALIVAGPPAALGGASVRLADCRWRPFFLWGGAGARLGADRRPRSSRFPARARTMAGDARASTAGLLADWIRQAIPTKRSLDLALHVF